MVCGLTLFLLLEGRGGGYRFFLGLERILDLMLSVNTHYISIKTHHIRSEIYGAACAP